MWRGKCVNHKHRIVPPVLVAADQFFIKTPNLLQECYTPVCKRTAHVDKPSSRGTKHSEGQRKRSWRSD
ncbi:hypothetical protein ABFA07_019998 [Porites harrisoni]